MRISSALPLLPAVVLLATGCSGAAPDGGRVATEQHVAIADQAERVADLIDADRTCEAAEALRRLEDLAGDRTASQDVRAAVESFVGSARTSVTCASPTPAPPPEDPGPPEDEGRGNGDEERDDEERDDEGRGNEGRGNGGRGNEGRGNGGGDDDD